LKIRYLPSQLPPKPTMYSDSGYLSFIRISQMFLFYFFFCFGGSGIWTRVMCFLCNCSNRAAKPQDQFGFR
jgi:hypothetical protein